MAISRHIFFPFSFFFFFNVGVIINKSIGGDNVVNDNHHHHHHHHRTQRLMICLEKLRENSSKNNNGVWNIWNITHTHTHKVDDFNFVMANEKKAAKHIYVFKIKK